MSGIARKLMSAGGEVSPAWDISLAESRTWDISAASYAGPNSFSVAAQDTAPEGLFFKPDGTKMYVVGSTGDAVYEYDLSIAWNVSSASFLQNFSVSAQETSPQEVFFKSDGTKMYVLGGSGVDVNEYDLSSAWDVSSASYLQNFSVSAQETGPQGLFFKPDGTKMYVIGFSGDDVNEYDLSSAWDVSSASYLQNFSVAAQDTAPRAVFFKPDGTKMYVLGGAGDDVNEYDLSSAWDVSSASYLQNFSVAAQEEGTQGLFFKPDGTKMYVIGNAGDDVNEYDLSSAWDVSSTSTTGYYNVSAEEALPQGLFFKSDGTKMYVTGSSGDDVNEYDLSTAWDVSSASYLQNFSVSAQETSPFGLFFKPDGTKMYVVGASGDDVNEYDLSSAWDISSASYLQNFSVAAQDTAPSGLFFKPDGTKMYVVGFIGDNVNEYDLSSAWDVSSASYLQNFSVSAQETAPQGLFFKSDGTKMYVVGSSGDDVNEYDLSSAWDVSSASYLQNFSVSAQETSPYGLFFKPDGTKMYVLGNSTKQVYEYNIGSFSVAAEVTIPQDVFFKPDGAKMYIVGNVSGGVYEYNLSTPWRVSSASYLQNFSTLSQESVPTGLFFKPDGTKMYVLGTGGDDVNEYNLSTAWDVSSASYLQNFSISTQDVNPISLFFKPDGTKMYFVGRDGDDVNEYDLSTAWDISSASFSQSFSVSAQDANPQGLFFKPNGTKMYVSGDSGDDVNEYNLSTAWDVSSASYLQNFFVGDQDSQPRNLFFKDDGLRMYMVGATSDTVYEYRIGPAT